MAIYLSAAAEVIDALGGTKAVADLTNRKMQHVSNWRAEGRLAADTFLIVTTELSKHGFEASPELWGITPAESANAGAS